MSATDSASQASPAKALPHIRVILLNGPPGSGKDAIGNLLKAAIDEQHKNAPQLLRAEVFKFASVLKTTALRIFPQVANFEHDKDDPAATQRVNFGVYCYTEPMRSRDEPASDA